MHLRAVRLRISTGEERLIGYEASEVLDVEPAKYYVQVTKREKRACKGSEEGGVSCAPLPERIIEKAWEVTGW